MSITYTRDGEDVFELPGRTVNTFASGLVRIDNSYLVKTSNIQAARNVSFKVGDAIYGDDTYPAVDGLFQYPEAQEVRKEYGMTELIASYYGRTRFDVPPPTVIERSIYGYDNGLIIETTNLYISINDLFFEFVVPVGEIINFRDRDLFDSVLSEPNSVYYDDGTGSEPVTFSKSTFTYKDFDYYNYVLPGSVSKQFRLVRPSIKVIAQRNFGNFVELEVTYIRDTTSQGYIDV